MFMFLSLQFSEGLNKLYVNKTKDDPTLKKQRCPVKFVTAIPAKFEGQFYVRAHVSFKELEHQRTPVVACPNDMHMGKLMQCEHPDAVEGQYEIHDSIRFPLDCCQGGVLSTAANFIFVCWSTDSSIKRRPVQLHFALEHEYVHSFSFCNLCNCSLNSIFSKIFLVIARWLS